MKLNELHANEGARNPARELDTAFQPGKARLPGAAPRGSAPVQERVVACTVRVATCHSSAVCHSFVARVSPRPIVYATMKSTLNNFPNCPQKQLSLLNCWRKRLLSHPASPVVILGNGELKHAITVKAHRFSKSAKAKIEAAGGTAELIVKQESK